MKTFLVRALALSAMMAAVPANAATYVRNGVIDTSAFTTGTVYNSTFLTSAKIDYDAIPTVVSGDVITGTVSFSGGRVATMYDAGSELLSFLLSGSNSAGKATYTLSFNGLSGAFKPTTNLFSGTGNGCCVGMSVVTNLTDSSFSFTGFDYTVTMQSANSNLDASSFQTRKISFADGVSAVPEPATWAMMALGFGVVGGAMRRRTAGRRASFA